MRVLGLIPARGGSKGVPRKNVRLLNGRPLLAYTADAAFAAHRLTRVILSTDNEEIASVGRELGLEVPFIRPSILAQDDTPMLPVVQHALRTIEAAGPAYHAVCILQPTAPFRRPEDIDGCIDLLDRQSADAVITVRPVPPEFNPHWVYLADPNGVLHLSVGGREPLARRQVLPPAYHRDGSVYVTRRDIVLERNSLYGERLYGYEMSSPTHENIDTPDDLARAERLLRDADRE